MQQTSRHILQPGLVIGFAAAVAMWIGWYVLHLPGVNAPSLIATPVLGGILILVCLKGSSLAGRTHRHSPWMVGLVAGFVAACVNLLLLGNRVVVQPESTEALTEHTNQLRPDAAAVVLGFLIVSALAGAVAGLVGSRFARDPSSQPMWIGRFASVLAFAIWPLVVAGGIVTSTESGMAVPDSVTTYGSVSFLFPLSLMAEPRVFFEHTHRLFGTLVGVTAIVLALWCMLRERAWVAGMCGLILIAMLGGVFAAESAETVSVAVAVWAIIGLTAIALVLTWRAIIFGRIGFGGVGILVLVIAQGLLGALRVSEISTPLAMVHGVLAQLVLACAAALASTMYRSQQQPASDLSGHTNRALQQGCGFAKLSLIALILQLILGAGYRHTGSHAYLGGHILLAIAVLTLVVLLGMSLRQADRESDLGRWAKRRGLGLIHLVSTQVALGIVAVILVVTADAQRPIPEAEELASAHALPVVEAIFTTAHQAIGAAILALTASSYIRTRSSSDAP